MHNANNTFNLAISLSSSLRLIFLFQASLLNIPSFLWRFFSGRLNMHSLNSPDLLIIMSLFLNLSPYRESS